MEQNINGDDKNNKIYMWKNKRVTEKMYNLRVKQSKTGQNNIKRKTIVDSPKKNIPKGVRLVDFEVMLQNMKCKSCTYKLSLDNIEQEKRKGLGSFFLIRCEYCLYVSKVPISHYHEGSDSNKAMFAINAKCALGAIHTGIGHTQVQKFLSILDVPHLTKSLFKKHERIVGNAIEAVAKESCVEAAEIERDLTLENIEKLKKLL